MIGIVIVAAGRGERLGHRLRKAMVPLGGRPLVQHSAETFSQIEEVSALVCVSHTEDHQALREALPAGTLFCEGGARRQDSVRLGLDALPAEIDRVMVHDAARPFISRDTVLALARALEKGEGAVPATPMTSTVKRVDADGRILETVPREALRAAQTPQAARRKALCDALDAASSAGVEVTDEMQALERAGLNVAVVDGSPWNFKVTTPEDLRLAEWCQRERPWEEADSRIQSDQEQTSMRIGTGYDIHRLVEGRPLILGGVEIPYERGLLGHSDADAVLHAITDALLGAAAQPDIGELFPDDDPRFKGANSADLLRAALERVREAGFAPVNVDLNVLAERPKLKPYKAAMRESIATILGLDLDRVSVKAKTREGLDAVGNREAIEVHSVLLLEHTTQPSTAPKLEG